jgi:hypothetical protein
MNLGHRYSVKAVTGRNPVDCKPYEVLLAVIVALIGKFGESVHNAE